MRWLQSCTALNRPEYSFEPLLNHISSLMEGEKVFLVLFPRKPRGLKSLSPGTAPAGCPPSSWPAPLLLSLLLSFFHMHPCPKQTPQGSPPRSLEFLGNLTYAFVLGRNMCWAVSFQRWREGRWLSLPFSTGLNPACNKTLGKGAISQPPCVWVGGVWEGICREMAIFPQISCRMGATVRTRTPAARFSWELCVENKFNYQHLVALIVWASDIGGSQ